MGRKVVSVSLSEEQDKFIEREAFERKISISEVFQKLIEEYMSKCVSKEYLFEQKRKFIQSIEDANHEIAKIDQRIEQIQLRPSLETKETPIVDRRERMAEELFSKGVGKITEEERFILRKKFKDSDHTYRTFEQFLNEEGYGYNDYSEIVKLIGVKQ